MRRQRARGLVHKRRRLRVELLEDRRLLAGAQEVEPNDEPQQANVVALQDSVAVPGLARGSVEGELHAAETDYFRFTAFAGDQVSLSVTAEGSDLDPEFVLRDGAGFQLARDADSGPGQDSLGATYTIGSSGNYFVEVAGDHSATSGAYQLDIITARGIGFESDPHQRNDALASAESASFVVNGSRCSVSARRDHCGRSRHRGSRCVGDQAARTIHRG